MNADQEYQHSFNHDDIDPRLLEDPEWQEAMRAAESPARVRGPVRRISPSARAGPAGFVSDNLYYSGGVSSDEELESALQQVASLESQQTPSAFAPPQLSQTALQQSARTNISRARPGTASSSSTSASTPSYASTMIHIDSDDDIPLIIDDSPEDLVAAPRASGAPSEQSTIDLDYQLALQLQREMSSENAGDTSIELLDFPSESSPLEHHQPVMPTAAPPPNHRGEQLRSMMRLHRETAPTGPQRGAAGFDTSGRRIGSNYSRAQFEPAGSRRNPAEAPRHQTTSFGHPSLSRSTTAPNASPIDITTPPRHTGSAMSGSNRTGYGFPMRSFQSPQSGSSTSAGDLSAPSHTTNSPFSRSRDASTQISRPLPPISRTRSAPVGPAHTPLFSDQSVGGYHTRPSDRTRSRQNARGGQNRVGTSTTYVVGSDSSYPSQVSVPEIDEDEARLRAGAGTRRRQVGRPLPNSQRLADMGVDVYALVNGRPESGPGSRRALLEQDEQLAQAIAQHDRFVGMPRGNQNRYYQRRGGFEVDTNDYEAMLRLSESAPPVKRGVSKALLSALPVVKASNDDCTICQGTADSAMVALPCLHNFHKECILPHLKTSRFCPNCRHEIE